jgi:hypothetical protein
MPLLGCDGSLSTKQHTWLPLTSVLYVLFLLSTRTVEVRIWIEFYFSSTTEYTIPINHFQWPGVLVSCMYY